MRSNRFDMGNSLEEISTFMVPSFNKMSLSSKVVNTVRNTGPHSPTFAHNSFQFGMQPSSTKEAGDLTKDYKRARKNANIFSQYK